MIHHNDNNNSKSKVSHGLVEDEDEDWLAVNPGLVDGGDSGDDHQQVKDGLRYELNHGDE